MAKSFMAGMTDYSHQSFADLITDLRNGELLASEAVDLIGSNLTKLQESGYHKKLPGNFLYLASYGLQCFKSVRSDLKDILTEINVEVQEYHCKVISNISDVTHKINIDIGRYWNNEFESFKNYEDEEFSLIEEIYNETRDVAASFLDFEELAKRLRHFIGKKNFKMENNNSGPNFNQANFGDNTVIVVGNNNEVSATQVKKNDLDSLEKYLASHKVSHSDIEELKSIVTSEQPDVENQKLGEKSNSWIAKMVNKCLDGSWAIGIGAAGKLLADAIKDYYGLFQKVM